MATDITINATKSLLSIVVDKADYPGTNYPDFIDIPIALLSMQKGESTAPLELINSATKQRYSFDTSNGVINVAAAAQATTAALRATIIAAV